MLACAAPLRDLHWGNVLVKTTKAKKGTFLLDGTNHSLETKGVLVHIIDFSLSRLQIGQSLLLYSTVYFVPSRVPSHLAHLVF